MAEPTFGVLGPLQVRASGAPVHIGGPKPRAVLATLLLQPGGFVSLDLLTEVLWPGGAPRSAVANVRTYVRMVRQALTAAGVSTAALRTGPSGYALEVAPDDSDMLLFERLLDQARAADDCGDDPAAQRGYEAALALWRGAALQDLPSSVVWDAAVTRIEELRSFAVDKCLEVRLRQGDYAPLVAELRTRLIQDQLREDLWRMLVQALHGAGRTTEARAAYAEAERTLAVELGVEPSGPLRAVGAEINGYAVRRRARAQVPVCQLPMDVEDFTGRSREVAVLEARLSAAGRAPVVVVVSGPPGSGKSTLAVHVAHRVRAAFPDGQLFVDLGGLSGRPREPADVLAEMLRGLGVIDSAIPAELGERAALFRSRLAQRRFLIVLDDAADGAQARPLLPGTGGSAVLVSSRRRMPGLPGYHCPLGVLPLDDARALLAGIVGADRLRLAGPDADRVITGCGALPLAVRIAGSRLANHPGWTVGTLADSLHDERGRLDQLQTGELEVRASAELSYFHLPGPAAETFRVFGQLPDEPVAGWLIAVAAGGAEEPADGLATLLDEHLVEVVATDRLGLRRYRMHALLRCYAQELADEEGPEVRLRRQLRLLDALIALTRCANAAMPTRFLGVLGTAVPPTGPATAVAEVVRAQPVAWFETERRLLVAAVESALLLGQVSRAAELAIEMASFFDMRGYYGDWLRTHRLVLDAMRAPSRDSPAGAPHATPVDARAAALLRNLGQLHLYQDRYADALAAFVASREIFATLGCPSGEAVAAVGAGSVHRVLGDLDAALRTFTEALHGFGAAGDRHGEAVARNAIASVWLERRDLDAAAPWLAGALELSRDLGDRHREAQVRRRIAVLHELRGEPGAACVELERALGIFDELADTHCAAYVQQSIGELCLRQGDAGKAAALLVDALAVQRQLGDRRAEARVACLLGELHRATGREHSARRYFHRSLSTWRRLDVHDQAELVDAKLRAVH
ncbi:DNA-binding transcriptional activator of the SARP family [Streptomyces zhaozhouensis]|uniref:DNA-binding transcriptional activator of the SARP family n=1 Tax=Streptomyces zhaozhouensis TaxID=1300267 RepID=A0A286E3G8_9ACTN|nr:BTAD domain-containing putative transcriptional regulator [Streptomyces zhaozhouensis]SOD65443.1 DNA-binding transcriptional activator of the SARP family [Streptomyces zhaozhouensis]